MGKTSSQVKQRYNEKAYDQIKLTVPKGEREKIKEYAESIGISVNQLYAIALERMMKDE